MESRTIKTKSEATPSNFDLARMDIALKAPRHRLPKELTRESFRAWMKSLQSNLTHSRQNKKA